MTKPNPSPLCSDALAPESLFSALIVDPTKEDSQWELFSYGRAQAMSDGGAPAKRYHTNLPRGGYSGLPMGWEMLVNRWYASASRALDDAVMEWASTVSVRFEYSIKTVTTAVLSDLLLGRVAMPATLMRENMKYEVNVISEDTGSLMALKAWLLEHSARPLLVTTPEQKVYYKQRTPTLTIWVHLEGAIKRLVC